MRLWIVSDQEDGELLDVNAFRTKEEALQYARHVANSVTDARVTAGEEGARTVELEAEAGYCAVREDEGDNVRELLVWEKTMP